MHSSSRFRFALLRCARLLSDEVNNVLMQHQLNYSLWQALVIIEMNPNCTAIDIAKELNISKPAVTKRMNTLHDLGLIEQLPLSDKRQKSLKLSQIGVSLYLQCSKEIDQLEADLLSPFDQDELQQSHGFILNLLDSLQHRKDQYHV
ncbi:transcriptional regulator [Acinetobacter sp. NCu2D-2]|uniref:MarR family winged helix-turn-helix transcriptional regulator n=1 Tax=Acinetobacter sp. NCu2D-2 TaxID=1608473 RepID=UPI0007CDC0F9|nr:MarR family transcriptional regulator [Acinetobacter sp. NCu2D-2]ANF81821.1 transcriptional regulator [Acinetobacter sp. NCu2D-2]